MKIDVSYGNEIQSISIPDEANVVDLSLNEVPKKNEMEVLNSALSNPVNSSSLGEFLTNTEKVLILVNDGSRPTPTARVLDFINHHLDGKNINFLVATGTHRKPTEEELETIFGKLQLSIHYLAPPFFQ